MQNHLYSSNTECIYLYKNPFYVICLSLYGEETIIVVTNFNIYFSRRICTFRMTIIAYLYSTFFRNVIIKIGVTFKNAAESNFSSIHSSVC